MNDNQVKDFFLKYITSESEFIPLGIVPSPALDLSTALNLYRNCYMSKLTGVLADRHQSIKNILGDELFKDIIFHFIKNNISKCWNINKYGTELNQFIKLEYPSLINDYPFLLDLMDFETSKELLFHTKIDKNLDILLDGKTIKKEFEIGQEKLSLIKIQFNPYINFVKSNFNIPEIYKAAINNTMEAPNNWNQSNSWIMYKENHIVYNKSISERVYQLCIILKNEVDLLTALSEIDQIVSLNQDKSDYSDIEDFFNFAKKLALQ